MANDIFSRQLSNLKINSEIIEVFCQTITIMMQDQAKNTLLLHKQLDDQIEKLNKRAANARILMLDAEITASDYQTIKAELQAEVEKLNLQKLAIVDNGKDAQYIATTQKPASALHYSRSTRQKRDHWFDVF